MAAEYQVDVKLDATKAEQGAKRVGAALDGVAASASKGRSELGAMASEGKAGLDELGEAAKTAFEFYAIKELVGELGHLTDSFTAIQNKLRSVSTDQANLNGLTDATYKIAQETRTEWDEVAMAYQRLGKATEHMGYSQKDVLDLTRTLTQAMIVSGATTQEAAMSLMEITHGFEIGTLQGREFKVLLKDATPIIGELAAALHMSRAEFIEMGKHGKLTAKMLGEAFKEAGPEIQAQFNKMAPTISQTFTVIENAAKKFFGELMTDSGVLHVIADATKFVVDHFDIFGKVLVSLGETVGVYFGVKMIGLAIDGLRSLGVAAATNPLGALLLLITAGIVTLRQFGDQIHLTAGGAATLGDAFREIWSELKEAGSAIMDFLGDAWKSLTSAFTDGLDSTGIKVSLDDVLHFIMAFVYSAVSIFRHFKDIVVITFGAIPVALVEAFDKAFPQITHTLEKIVNAVLDAVSGLRNLGNIPRVKELNDEINGLQELQSQQGGAVSQEMKGANNPHTLDVMRKTYGDRAALIRKDQAELNSYTSGKATEFHIELDRTAIAGATDAAKTMIDDTWKSIQDDVEGGLKKFDDGIAKRTAERQASERKSTVNAKGGTADPEAPDAKAAKAYAKLEKEYLALVGQSNPIAEAQYKIAKAQELVNRAVAAGIAPISEAEEVMDNLREKLKDQLDPYGAYIDAQLRERAALMMNTREREVFLAVESEEQRLRKQGLTIDEQKHGQITRMTRDLIALRESTAGEENVLKSIQAPDVQYLTTVRALDQLLKDHKITIDQYAKAMNAAKDAYVATTPAALSFSNGVMQGLKAIAAQTLDVAGSVKTTMVNAFNGVNTALTDLIVKGKADWHSLVQSMEADVTQLILKMLELKLFQAVVPGGALPGFATGGSFTVGGTGGTDTQLVAFRATPGERVVVQTPGQQGTSGGSQKSGGGGTVINLRSVNVTDPNQAIHAVDSRQGEKVFTNFVRRNPGLLRGITGTRR